MRLCECVLWCGIVLSASAASARDIYVSNTAGDDRWQGIETENRFEGAGPTRTIAKALRIAAAGDRIVIANTDVPYRESLSLVGERHSGFPHEPFTIEGNGAVLDGSAPVVPEAWEYYTGDVFRFRPARLGHQQLFLGDRPAVRRPARSADYKLPELAPLEWCLAGGYINLRVEAGKIPQQYEASYATLQTGVTLYQVHDVRISNLVVQGFQLDGINAHDSVFGGQLAGVLCRGNGRAGISVGGASRVEIIDSVSGDNGAAQLRIEGYSHTHVTDTELIDNTAPATVVRGGKLYIDGKRVDAGSVDL